MQQCHRHKALLAALLTAPLLLGMGSTGGKDVIQPPIDIRAVLTDRDGTKVDLSRFNIDGRVDLEGEMGRGTLRIAFEDIREIEFGDDLTGDALRVHVVGQAMLQDDEARADVLQRGDFFLQLQDERVGPLDVGASVEVVADPRGNGGDLRPEFVGALAESGGCDRGRGRGGYPPEPACG